MIPSPVLFDLKVPQSSPVDQRGKVPQDPVTSLINLQTPPPEEQAEAPAGKALSITEPTVPPTDTLTPPPETAPSPTEVGCVADSTKTQNSTEPGKERDIFYVHADSLIRWHSSVLLLKRVKKLHLCLS